MAKIVKMQSPTLTVIFGLIALIFASTTIFFKHRVSLLQSQLLDTHQRIKRDVVLDVSSDEYFPLYTQLSAKSIKRICNKQWRFGKTPTQMHIKQPKQCTKITGLKVESKWKRPFQVGSASKCQNSWLISEFSSGYSLFEYQNKKQPTSIYTLPEPFEGTDFTSHCDSNGNKNFIYFSSNVGWQSGSIIKFDLQTQKYIRTVLIASETPLYQNSSSVVDLEVDHEWLWVIYRLPSESNIAVTKFLLNNLKQAGGWILDDYRLKNATNSFISCSTLYSVNFNLSTRMQQIEAVYNFDTNTYLVTEGIALAWKARDPTIQNLHHNPCTDSLDVFENGLVYSVQLSRNF